MLKESIIGTLSSFACFSILVTHSVSSGNVPVKYCFNCSSICVPPYIIFQFLTKTGNVKRYSHSHVYLIYFFFSFTCRSEEHTSELQSRFDLVCRLLLV